MCFSLRLNHSADADLPLMKSNVITTISIFTVSVESGSYIVSLSMSDYRNNFGYQMLLFSVWNEVTIYIHEESTLTS